MLETFLAAAETLSDADPHDEHVEARHELVVGVWTGLAIALAGVPDGTLAALRVRLLACVGKAQRPRGAGEPPAAGREVAASGRAIRARLGVDGGGLSVVEHHEDDLQRALSTGEPRQPKPPSGA